MLRGGSMLSSMLSRFHVIHVKNGSMLLHVKNGPMQPGLTWKVHVNAKKSAEGRTTRNGGTTPLPEPLPLYLRATPHMQRPACATKVSLRFPSSAEVGPGKMGSPSPPLGPSPCNEKAPRQIHRPACATTHKPPHGSRSQNLNC